MIKSLFIIAYFLAIGVASTASQTSVNRQSTNNTDPVIVVDKWDIDFGNVPVNTTSEPQSLTISGINLTGKITYALKENGGKTDVINFSIDKPDWDSQQGGTVYITFDPKKERAYNVKLEIVSDGVPTLTIPITGYGILPTSSDEILGNPAITTSALNNRLEIKNLPMDSAIEVYDPAGRMIVARAAVSNVMSFAVERKGLYIVIVRHRSETRVLKTFYK